ncbi:MAG: amidohydrolase [Acidobacteriota bacterium]|jgi:predicted amidohydrolase YtcJ
MLTCAVALLASGCAEGFTPPPADLVLRGGRVYTLDWGEPDRSGEPAADAPHDASGWHPDATAVATERGTILFVGDDEGVERYIGNRTRVVELDGATLIPGLVDAHTHVLNLGTTLEQVDLVDAVDEADAVARVASRARDVPAGSWIIGYGWDDGAWADDYPDKALLSQAVPDHPVLMRGLHGFAVWGNQAALDAARIGAATPDPEGGIIERDASGNPTGLLRDRATELLTGAVPPPTPEQIEARYLLGFGEMARSGFTMVHEAGVDAPAMRALENLAAGGRLPLRVYAMLDARDPELLRRWMRWGPDTDGNDLLITRAVKAYYDGALGSRGARLLEPYSDRPDEYGVAGNEYGFDEELVAQMMGAGFQAAVHAIGDAGNRETLDFFERVLRRDPGARALRNRVEHAQVVQAGDFWRFRTLGLTASMQPPHAVEDKAWAIERLGPERLAGAYAWRTFRAIRVPLVFSSDLPGSDHDIFYGLHSAIARTDKELQPPGGWFPDQRMSAEEALRGYTSWAARAALVEATAGRLAVGLWADMTVLDIDPLAVGSTDPDALLRGHILMTIVDGRVVYDPTSNE